ncbi:hypothetical protein EBR96_08090 [bacterium]|nr:hypothetical protein [bacterium]
MVQVPKTTLFAKTIAAGSTVTQEPPNCLLYSLQTILGRRINIEKWTPVYLQWSETKAGFPPLLKTEINFLDQWSSPKRLNSDNILADFNAYIGSFEAPKQVIMNVFPEPRATPENPGHSFLIRFWIGKDGVQAQLSDITLINGRLERVIRISKPDFSGRLDIDEVISAHVDGLNQGKEIPYTQYSLVLIHDMLPAYKRLFTRCLVQ